MNSSSEPPSSVNSYDQSKTFPKRRRHIVGLLNQGGTCYLNSLLQTLFHTPEFTYRLFNLTTRSNKSGLKSIIRELLRLFYGLMTLRKYAISSKSLTDSFGWTDDQVFVHQDVQELNRLLFEEIETSLKGTVEANLINDLYRGLITTKIKCLRCDYCSVREDEYLDVNLAVIEHDSVEKCLKAQNIIEKLNGDNQYFCDRCQKKVDAIKAHYFKEYPPILTLCLARFDFDPRTMQSIKVDKTCTFPLTLDVSEFMEVRPKSKIIFDLFSIVIHVGNSTLGGHYHAYIKDPYGFEMNKEENENNIILETNTNPSSVTLTTNNRKDFSQVYSEDGELENKMEAEITIQNDSNLMGQSQQLYHSDEHQIDTMEVEDLVTMTGDSNNDLPNIGSSTDNEIDSQSSTFGSKKSTSKFGAIFEAIRNFWSGNHVAVTCPSHISVATTTTNSNMSPDESYDVVIDDSKYDANDEGDDEESDDNKDVNSSYSINEEHADISSFTSCYKTKDTNNNELLQGWQSKIFDKNSNKKSMNLDNTNESDDSNAVMDSKSSKSKPSNPTNSRSFITTNSKMRIQSDTSGINNKPHQSTTHSDKLDSKIELKLSKSDSSEGSKVKKKFIQSGRWFDFNDESITEIRTQDFHKVFQGSECAYILFYRQRNLQNKK